LPTDAVVRLVEGSEDRESIMKNAIWYDVDQIPHKRNRFENWFYDLSLIPRNPINRGKPKRYPDVRQDWSK
jgi:hypothetical protein